MSDQHPAVPTADLVTLEADLADHVIDLLAAAGVLALDRPASGGLTTIVIRERDLATARATLDLVLPGLLAEESGHLLDDDGPKRLSDRLIRRTDWPAESAPRDGGLLDGRAAFADSVDGPLRPMGEAEDDDDFVPQPPPPIPRGDTVSRFAWLCVVGGPLIMLLALLVHLPGTVAAIGLGAFIAGFVVLVARMPDRARQDDGWDDGAVL